METGINQKNRRIQKRKEEILHFSSEADNQYIQSCRQQLQKKEAQLKILESMPVRMTYKTKVTWYRLRSAIIQEIDKIKWNIDLHEESTIARGLFYGLYDD